MVVAASEWIDGLVASCGLFFVVVVYCVFLTDSLRVFYTLPSVVLNHQSRRFFLQDFTVLLAVHLSRFEKLIPENIAEFRVIGFFGFSRRYSRRFFYLYAHSLDELPFY